MDDLLDVEPFDHTEGNVEEGIPDEAVEATDENSNFNGYKNGDNNDKENVANGEDEEVIEVKGAIFSLTGGGFTGAATSIRTQQMLRNLLKTRRAATVTASKVEQSSRDCKNVFIDEGKQVHTIQSQLGHMSLPFSLTIIPLCSTLVSKLSDYLDLRTS